MVTTITKLREAVRHIDTRRVKGRVTKALGTIVEAVVPDVRIGEVCVLEDPDGNWSTTAEVIGLGEDTVLLTPLGDLQGMSQRTSVLPTGLTLDTPVGDALLGRIVDGLGNPLDGRGPLVGPGTRRPLHRPAPPALARQLIARPLPIGLRVIDALLTCGEGQRIGIYGEPGAGKSSLVAQMVNGAVVDVAVVALIGERGREVREFIENKLGVQGMRRSVIVVATSDRSAIERVKAAYVATTLAEAFRDEGRRVLLMMDSITRFARALREIGLAAGEPPARRGFPPSVFASLPQLIERAGPGEQGSITGFFTVLVEGDGVGDPIAEETRAILDGHIILSQQLASANHYPAIDVLASRSRVMDAIVSSEHKANAGRIRELLARYAEVEFLIQVGEYKSGADAVADTAIAKINDIRSFLRQATDERSSFEETTRCMSLLVA
ncbi:MAG: type III secretion system ATPase SctN [Hyphomicrobiaceae bacterium]|nr:type III secretion system ATPase SctN [Hyphomicrobiaceae bacterium]